MFSRDNWNEIIEALSSNWFRTTLTAFGVLWGIFILVILLAAGKGLENGVKQGFGGIATNSMFMWTQTVSRPYKGLPKGRQYNFKISDVAAIKEAVPDLRFVSPRNQLGGFGGTNNVVRGLNTGAYNVYGDYPEIIQQEPMDITSGRFVNYSDINEKRKVAIIGEGVRREMYDQGRRSAWFLHQDQRGQFYGDWNLQKERQQRQYGRGPETDLCAFHCLFAGV